MGSDIRVSKKLIKLVGQNLYSASPIFPVTVRELLQNSIDAQKTKGVDQPVNFTIAMNAEDMKVSLTCADAGVGMNKETINEKFLVIGESGKEDGVGGFGIAKAAIVLSCDSWSLATQDNQFGGFGLEVAEQAASSFVDGCNIRLEYENRKNSRVYPGNYNFGAAVNYLVTSDAKTSITFVNTNTERTLEEKATYNGLQVTNKTLLETLECGCSKIELHCVPTIVYKSMSMYQSSINTYDNEKLGGRIIYRLNGLTQFLAYGYGDADFNIVVEVSTTARPDSEDYPFTLSREEINTEIQSLLSSKLRNYFTNSQTTKIKLKELNGDKQVYRECYSGYLHSGLSKREIKAQEAIQMQHEEDKEYETEMSRAVTPLIVSRLGSTKASKEEYETQYLSDLLEMSPFGIKTLIERTSKTLKLNIKSNKFNKLLQAWTELVALVMSATPDYKHDFGIGLILDNDYAALRTYHEGTIYYQVNPLDLKVSDPTTTVTRMLFLACHEVAHTQYSSHNECFVIAHGRLMENFLKEYGMKAVYEISRVLRA